VIREGVAVSGVVLAAVDASCDVVVGVEAIRVGLQIMLQSKASSALSQALSATIEEVKTKAASKLRKIVMALRLCTSHAAPELALAAFGAPIYVARPHVGRHRA